jgi:hypothetical protein
LSNDEKIKIMEIARSITGKADEILGIYDKLASAIAIERCPVSS